MTGKLLPALVLAMGCASAQTPGGRWDGTIDFNGLAVPFSIHFEGSGRTFAGAFVNGDTRAPSTSGSFDAGVLRLDFKQAGGRLEAVLGADGQLKGSYRGARPGTHPFTAAAFCTCLYEGEAGPEIAGTWDLPDAGWRLTVRRKGEDTFAIVSRPGGDLGPAAGRFDGLTFMLHYFDGVGAAVLEIEQRKDGGLEVALKEPGAAVRKHRAIRAAAPR